MRVCRYCLLYTSSILKIYNIIRTRSDLEALLMNISIHQQSDPKLRNIKDRLAEQDDTISKFYYINNGTLFIKTTLNQETWKVIIPTNIEKDIIKTTMYDMAIWEP